MVDSVYRTRSLGVAATGLPDQYADGKAARVWEYYIGCKQNRTSQYKNWITSLLNNHNCTNLLDAACGTGVDSMMLVEAGFNVISTDASDKMLKYALQERWARRKEPEFDKWVIEEANWLTLVDDLEDIEKPEGGYDAVLCLGNSFAHLPDFEGNNSNQKVALCNFRDMVKPGGILVIDHRNYDAILDSGAVPAKNIYYNSQHITDIKCSNLYVNGSPTMVTLDYTMDLHSLANTTSKSDKKFNLENSTQRFRLSYYPHRLEAFNDLLMEVFGNTCRHSVYGDFQPYNKEDTPAYFIHIVEKAA